MLGLPTFGLALAITVLSTYLPVIANGFTQSTTAIGLLIGAEGILALFVPLTVGAWSDRLRTRLGGRLPFVIAGAPVAGLALAALGFSRGLLLTAVLVVVFFLAYFIAYEPYRALYPDLVDDEIAGRAQSSQAAVRGAGTGAALLAGGLLMAVAQPLPFVIGGILMVASVGAFIHACTRNGMVRQDYDDSGAQGARETARELRQLLRDHPALRWFLGANALWELSLGALKTFIVLFLTKGVGMTLSQASLAIGATAVLILAGATGAGKAADRFGALRVVHVSLWFYGIAFLVPFATQSWFAVIAVPVLAIGGGVLMALPYALLMPLMPEAAHGTLTGYYSLSRGLGTMLGPILAGIAIQIGKGPLDGSHGYAAMFLVCSLSILASIPLLRGLGRAADDRHELERA